MVGRGLIIPQSIEVCYTRWSTRNHVHRRRLIELAEVTACGCHSVERSRTTELNKETSWDGPIPELQQGYVLQGKINLQSGLLCSRDCHYYPIGDFTLLVVTPTCLKTG